MSVPCQIWIVSGAYCSVFQAVTAPMSSLNAIAVEAYKKYILVSLIQNGQVCFHSAFSTAVRVNAEPEDTLFPPDDQLQQVYSPLDLLDVAIAK